MCERECSRASVASRIVSRRSHRLRGVEDCTSQGRVSPALRAACRETRHETRHRGPRFVQVLRSDRAGAWDQLLGLQRADIRLLRGERCRERRQRSRSLRVIERGILATSLCSASIRGTRQGRGATGSVSSSRTQRSTPCSRCVRPSRCSLDTLRPPRQWTTCFVPVVFLTSLMSASADCLEAKDARSMSRLGLVGDPEILFLDEPTTGLDPAARREMWTVIGDLREVEKTVFLTTHYMDEAQHLSDDIVILRAGSIVAQGSPDQLSRSLGAASQISFELPTWVPFDSIELPIGTARCESGRVQFQSVAVQRDLGTLLTWAESERIELANLTVKQPTLDDVFVQLATWSQDDLRSSESLGGR